jgi:protein SCO1/2
MTSNLSKVQKYLGEHVGREVVMLSISIDPQTDTPPVLKKYADSFKAQPGWYFLTGKKENIDRVLSKLGGYVEDKMQHSAVLLIGNEAAGDWMKVHAMSRPAEISGAVMQMIESQEKARADASQSSHSSR